MTVVGLLDCGFGYVQVVLPLEKVREVLPAHNQNKPSEKYIRVVTIDGHDFWFMGFVNYDNGLKNMQEAVAVTRRGEPVSPAAAQAQGVKQQNQNASYPPINQGDSSSTARNNAVVNLAMESVCMEVSDTGIISRCDRNT